MRTSTVARVSAKATALCCLCRASPTSTHAAWFLYSWTGELLPQPSNTAGGSGAPATGMCEAPETVEQAPRKRRCMPAADAADAQRQQLDTSLTAAAEQGRSKRARFSLDDAAPARHIMPDASPAPPPAAAGGAAGGGLTSPSKRIHRKQQQQLQQQQDEQVGGGTKTLMSPPPPRQAPARQQRPRRHPQSPAQQPRTQLLSPQKHGTRASTRAAAAAAAAVTATGSPSLSGLSGLAAASSTAAASAAGDTAAGEEDSEAICLRTRSKHPIAEQEFDPDMFDRLLAEFDPDLEPLLDEEMYQQFLQVWSAVLCWVGTACWGLLVGGGSCSTSVKG